MGREEVGIENDYPGGAKALRRHPITTPRQPPPRRDGNRADTGTDGKPSERRDEIVFEGILHQKDDAQKKREPAEPGEKFYARECFPIERRRRRGRRD